MASLLSRFTTFQPNTTILSNDMNQELNRIVNLLNGTTTNLKTVLKTSDAGDAPLDLDQLSTGPIQRWLQGGIEKGRIGNDGAFTTSGNITINNAAPALIFDDTAGTDAKIDLDVSVLRFGSLATNQISLDVSSGIATFSQIPVLPASNPTTANQAARKQYVDETATAWSVNFFEADPSTTTTANEDRPAFFVPDGTTIKVTKLKVMFKAGSHTAAGVLTYTIRRRAADGTGTTDLGSISLNDTNNTVHVVYTNDISDFTLTAGDSLSYFLATRTGTITERSVSIGAVGTQLRIV